MKKIILITCICCLILATSWVKNSTKEIEDKTFTINENIRSLKAELEDALLEYDYLSSPKKLTHFQNQYFEKDLTQIDITKVKKINQINDKLKIVDFKKNQNDE